MKPAQMVNRLLGQGNRSSGAQAAEASALSAVSPGDIGIICIHRAQVGGFGLSCSCHGPKSALYLLSTHHVWTEFGTAKIDACACRWP